LERKFFTKISEMGEVSMRSTNRGQARTESSARSRQAEESQENFGISALTRCLVDADARTTAGAGRARRKALGVSALAQFGTLIAILIVPLFATGTRLILRPTNFVPLPPYGGAPRHNSAGVQRTTLSATHESRDTFHYPQIKAPTRPTTRSDATDNGDPKIGGSDSRHEHFILGAGDGSGGAPNILIGDGLGSQPPRPDATPMTPSRKPLTVSQGVQLALLTRRVEPSYPSLARQMRREGRVELRATISSDGTIKDLEVLSGDPMLAKAAREAVIQWRFRPTFLNGIAVEVVTFITVNFHIGE
jgi:TonB family protein